MWAVTEEDHVNFGSPFCFVLFVFEPTLKKKNKFDMQ